MKIGTRIWVTSLLATALLGAVGFWMFWQMSGRLTERQDAINDASGLSEAALNFNVESFHTQLEIWEYAYQPTEKRLDAFYQHEAVFDELFDVLVTGSESADLSTEDRATMARIQSRIDDVRATWVELIVASERAATGTIEEGSGDYPYLQYPMFDPATVGHDDPAIRAVILNGADIFDDSHFNNTVDTFVISQATQLDMQIEEMGVLKSSLTRQFLGAFSLVIVAAFLMIFRDVRKHKGLESRLERQAFHDELTNLPNRTALLEILDEVVNSGNSSAGHTSAMFIDVDNFKLVNDSLGHAAGDGLLALIADRIAKSMRVGDRLGRLGGDEFLVLCHPVASAGETMAIATRIVQSMEQPFTVAGHELRVTVSIGVALVEANDTADDFLAAADVAVYEAKANGRNRVELFDSTLRQRAEDELRIANSLTKSIKQGDELVPHYQPIVDLESGQVVGFEALCRWHHPERGLLTAGAFIDVAETHGLEVALSWSILEDVVAQLAEWEADPRVRHPVWVSVNVSARQLRDPNYPKNVKKCIEDAGIPPELLCIEVTERTIVGDLESGADSLAELRNFGVRVAIDDFGTGNSSLGYLRSLPFDIVKLDMSFVHGITESYEARAIVAAVVEMTRALGHTVVAEGVETAEQMEILRDLRCDRGQGYMFAAAMAPEAADQMLAAAPLLPATTHSPHSRGL